MKDPVLYILMRNDLASMNPGKAMAQASHASNAFIHQYDIKIHTIDKVYAMLVEEWKSSTNQGFGTVLVLSANYDEMIQAIGNAKEMGFELSDVVVDPTYPYIVNTEVASLISELSDTSFRKKLNDKEMLLFRKEITCGYIFGDKGKLEFLLDRFSLHP